MSPQKIEKWIKYTEDNDVKKKTLNDVIATALTKLSLWKLKS